MLSRLKELFGSRKDPGRPRPRRGLCDLPERFGIISETSSQGSMSRVYRAIDNETGRTVCLKVQDRKKCEAAAARAQDEKPPEGEIGARIIHPHIARTLEYGTTLKGEQYMVMEFVDGLNLRQVRETVKVNLKGKLKLLAQAADGLAAVHAAGFIHHDVNPGNVLVNKLNQVKIIDFGLTVPNTAPFRQPGNRTGMLQYMAPELLKREPKDERLDIFAFGALAFEFLTDKLPFGGGDSHAMMLQRINSEPLDPAEINPRLPAELCAILKRSLARRKEDRWPAMPPLAAALRQVREALSAEKG